MSSALSDLLRARFGDADAATYNKWLSDPQIAKCIIENVVGSADYAKSCATVQAVCEGKLPVAQATGPLGTVLSGVRDAAGVAAATSKTPAGDRPREDGLPEALREAATLKQEHGLLLNALPVDVAVFRQRAERIDLLRDLVQDGAGFTRSCFVALAQAEREAERDLRDAVNLVRPVLAQRVPERETQQVLDYLYGSAEAGAQRNKENQTTLAALQDQARQAVTVETRQQARNELTRELSSLLGELRLDKDDDLNAAISKPKK